MGPQAKIRWVFIDFSIENAILESENAKCFACGALECWKHHRTIGLVQNRRQAPICLDHGFGLSLDYTRGEGGVKISKCWITLFLDGPLPTMTLCHKSVYFADFESYEPVRVCGLPEEQCGSCSKSCDLRIFLVLLWYYATNNVILEGTVLLGVDNLEIWFCHGTR